MSGVSRSLSRGLICCAALAAAGLWLALASTADANPPSFTWTGASASSANWSSAANWEGGLAPSSSTTVEKLDFPQLPSECSAEPPAHACYESVNDLAGVTAESMQIDDGEYYGIFGEPITLGAGGLSASPAATTSELTLAVVFTPLVLDSAQTWHIAGAGRNRIAENQLYLGEPVTGGSGDKLNVEMSSGGALDVGGEVEAGPVAVEGAAPGEPGAVNGVVGLFGGTINASDGEPVSVSHVFFWGAGAVGPLTSTGAELDVVSGEASWEGTLAAAGATFDSESWVGFEITGASGTAGGDYSHLVSSGAVALGNSELAVRVAPPGEKKSCPSLTIGRKYTLVTTTAGLSGVFGNAPASGDEIPITFAKACTEVEQTLRIEYNRSGGTQTITATVVGPTSSTKLSALPTNPVTNQSVTLTATVEASVGSPAGRVEFRDGAAGIPGCSSDAVAQTGASYAATCQTSFAASGSPVDLSAVFTPNQGVNLEGSTSAPEALTVGQGTTTTALRVSNAAPLAGAGVTYTATVTPGINGPTGPSGSVAFLDGGAPIGSCAAQPVAAGAASCTLTYSTTGTHTIAAQYVGNADFTGSSSSAQTVTVEPQPTGSPGPPNTGPPNTGPPKTTPPSEEISLASTDLGVRSTGVALVEMHCTGALVACSGTLTLAVRESPHGKGAHKSASTVTIGTATFTIASGVTTAVRLRLTAAGRALLHADHGHLSAVLTVAGSGAGAPPPRVESVHLTLQRSKPSARRRKK
jgi:Bacterial Ig-like domain (group 3)